MELMEKLKKIPKKKIAVICLLIALFVISMAITYNIAKRSNEPVIDGNDTAPTPDSNSISVLKPVEDTSTEEETTKAPVETVKPIDLSGINGLTYVSQGNGTCYIGGIGSCTDIDLKIPAYSPYGDKVTRIGDGAFTNCTEILSITIPASVRTIGTGAFRGCGSLVSINVEEGNSVYCSVGGVLMSKDKSILVCMPINRPGSSYLLDSGVEAIAAYAFESSANLKNLLYSGSISDYQKIDILLGNNLLDKIAITCNYKSSK